MNSSPATCDTLPLPADPILILPGLAFWRHIADEIEAELVVQGRVDRIRQADKAERIAVGRRACERLGGNVGPGARPVLNDDGLAQPFLQPLTDQAPDDIGPAAGGKAYEQTHRTRRIGLCPRHAR